MITPVLYTFRRCPYCMRAHMALKKAGIKVELREVKLSAMPDELLAVSPDKTVPVLVLEDGTSIDESWQIVQWALAQNDPDNWLGKSQQGDNSALLLDAEILIESNDYSFKLDLDHYKYADRYPEHDQTYYRQACEEFIEDLEEMLKQKPYLIADHLSLADIGVFPFIRQFSLVDIDWFQQAPYPNVQSWLQNLINSALFQNVFQKHDLWKKGDTTIYV